MKILICGRSGSGKSTFAEKLYNEIILNKSCDIINGDKIRQEHNDWDFTIEGRIRQCLRIKNLADEAKLQDLVTISDFICPTRHLRELFEPDLLIYMHGDPTNQYPDTDNLFEEPTEDEYDFKLSLNDDLNKWAATLADLAWILE